MLIYQYYFLINIVKYLIGSINIYYYLLIIKAITKMNNLPSLLQYNSDEFLSFNTKFDNEIISNKACKKLLKKFNIELSYQEMQNFLKNNTLSPNLLNFMFNYLQNLD